MDDVYTEKHQVVYYEVDVSAKLSIPMILNLAILGSTNQSAALGMDNERIHANNVGWVVLQYDMQIDRRPKVDEVINIKTQAVEYNPFFAVRKFWLEGLDGEPLVTINSIFAMIDMQARKMIRIPQVMMDTYQAKRVKHITRIPDPQDITTTTTEPQATNYHVRFFDIDHNHHVNNAHYFAWMQDPLGADFLKKYETKRVNIKYENEIRYGSEVVSYYKILPSVGGEVITLHQIKVDGQVMTEAEMYWQENQA